MGSIPEPAAAYDSEYALSCIGLEYGNVFHPYPAMADLLQPGIAFFRSTWLDFPPKGSHGKRFHIIDHLMIEPLDGLLQDLAQILEVEQQSGLVQFLAALVVVPVRIFRTCPLSRAGASRRNSVNFISNMHSPGNR